MEELIRPNWHIALVHFPLAFLVIGSLVEVFSFLGWRRSSFRWAGRWMLLIGAIFAVPATFSGLYAMADVVPDGLSGMDDANPAKEALRDHLLMLSVATGASILLVTFWIACNDTWRDRLGLFFKLGLLVVLLLTLVGTHHGGDLVYGFKIGVHGEGASTLPTSLPAGPISDALDEALGAEQMHVIVAGFALAMACVCLGLSFRAAAQPDDLYIDESAGMQQIAVAFGPTGGSINDPRQLLAPSEHVRSLNHTRRPPAARFWLLTTFLLILTSALGLWYLTIAEGTRDVETLRRAITLPLNEHDPSLTRRFAHVVTGVVIIADSLLLLFAAAAARRSKLILVLLAAPMITAIAVQVWLGILLVLEGPGWKVTEFMP
ncbi:MAG: hypothetical protein H7144_00070 [Burkholderiales bacterium]|nr:hypothetical protein [Phycisphaerae bacterium]